MGVWINIATLKHKLVLSSKAEDAIFCESEILLLVIYPRDNCTWAMEDKNSNKKFTAALVLITKNN